MDEDVVNALAVRARAGDEGAFRRLVELLTRPLVAMAYRYAHDWDWARDLTQETWVRVHQALPAYDPPRSFVSWIYAVHRNGCIDHARRPWTSRERSGHDEAELARMAGRAASDPAADVERAELRERVIAATRSLSERERDVFVRVDVRDEERAAVARDLGIRPGTLRAALHHARRKVAAILTSSENKS